MRNRGLQRCRPTFTLSIGEKESAKLLHRQEWKGKKMDWMNEMGEMVSFEAEGFEEMADRKFAEMIDAQERAIIDACPCETAGTIEAVDAILAGSCRSCGWNA